MLGLNNVFFSYKYYICLVSGDSESAVAIDVTDVDMISMLKLGINFYVPIVPTYVNRFFCIITSMFDLKN